MRKRMVTGACLVMLMGGAAYAIDDQAGVDACTEELARVEGIFHDKIEGADSPNEAMVEKASMLLDDADAQCGLVEYRPPGPKVRRRSGDARGCRLCRLP
jgi:hypothetical protein